MTERGQIENASAQLGRWRRRVWVETFQKVKRIRSQSGESGEGNGGVYASQGKSTPSEILGEGGESS